MNLRTKKSSGHRRNNKKNEKSLVVYIGVYSFILICLFSCVFGATLYFDGQSEKMNRSIAKNDVNSYKLQREIQNLKIKLENLSRKEYVVSKIKRYKLGLHTPRPFQVVHSTTNKVDSYNNKISRQLAYNTR